ncbi:reverse transcriptase family protein PWA37_004417 [Arxiozyma heterogenica]|uniref:reverse transcriptase family protein n=1 Tax=Arxiozyma heterogenica TaxID=278026 RepID=UPI002EED25F7
MHVNYRALNTATVKDSFPLFRIYNILTKIDSSKNFSTLDLHSGYHQIPMKMNDCFKIVFVTPNEKYENTVTPFSLVNDSSTFARRIDDLFKDLPYVCVYLDDILVHSRTLNEHWKHLDIVLQRLQLEGLIVKKKKCNFAVKSVEFLGYTIPPNKI